MTTFDPFAPRKTPTGVEPLTEAYDQSPEARALVREITSGTTTRTTDVTVWWMGAHLALVSRKGEKGFVSRGVQGYTPAFYEAFDMHTRGNLGTFLPKVVALADLVAPCVASMPPDVKKEKDVGTGGYAGGYNVPAAILGRAGTVVWRERMQEWIKVLRGIESRYMDLAEAARVREKAKQEADAKRKREEEAARRAEAKLHGAAPKMAAALRDLAGFTARVAQGAAVTRQEAEAAGRVILAALSEAGVSAKVGESVVERLNEVAPS